MRVPIARARALATRRPIKDSAAKVLDQRFAFGLGRAVVESFNALLLERSRGLGDMP